MTEWLTGKLGVPANEYHQADGSGMSRDNRASANAFIHLLRYMWKSPWREDFVSSLPYSGDPDSKFGHRLRAAPYARQVYAKTGYIVGVVGLSGYVHGAQRQDLRVLVRLQPLPRRRLRGVPAAGRDAEGDHYAVGRSRRRRGRCELS